MSEPRYGQCVCGVGLIDPYHMPGCPRFKEGKELSPKAKEMIRNLVKAVHPNWKPPMNNPHIVVDPATRRCMCGMYDGTPVTCAELLVMADKSMTVKMALLAHTVDCSEPFQSTPSDTTCAKCGAALSVSVDNTGWVNVAPHKCSPATTGSKQS